MLMSATPIQRKPDHTMYPGAVVYLEPYSDVQNTKIVLNS